jgi:enterochelin esterase-like enzyme
MDRRVRCLGGVVAVAGLMLVTPKAAGTQGAATSPVPPPPARLESPVVEGGRVTFRVYAPKASAVSLRSGEISYATRGPNTFIRHDTTGVWNFDAKPFTRGADGVWTLTVTLPPGLYDYMFDVDGLVVVDPENPRVIGNTRGARGLVEVPGPAGKPRHDEWRDVPHGTVTTHWYDSRVTGTRRRMHVYVPPGYDPDSTRRYPVLYLLHGNSGHDGQWVQIGRANVVADNLIADGEILPMILVMPDGHPERGPDGEVSPERRSNKAELFAGDLLKEVLPLVERIYRVTADADHRAIAGLSMGGGHSLTAGLRNPERFAWIGGFSASLGAALPLVPAVGAAADAFNARVRLFWVHIGRDDYVPLVKINREFAEKLKAAGVRHEYVETDGMHMWSVWRQYLADFMPRLFRASPNALTADEKAAGWRLLFDGQTTKGWRGFRADTSRRGPWAVEDGCLKRPAAGTGDDQGGGDIVTEEKFSDFDLRWEWRVGPRGNSGIKYFVTEERTKPIAHEYQMLDDAGYVGEAKEAQQTGSFYDVLPPSRDGRRPTGEWNESRILVRGHDVEHWLNGQKVLAYELGSAPVKAAVARSKFKDVAGFGTKIDGHILLQDHDGGGVCFRNIKIQSPPR